MPAIITREGSQRRLGDFINTVKTDKKLYVGLGRRDTAWSGSPDQIQDTPEEMDNFWTDLIGIKKVSVKDVIPMIPDRPWTSGTTYEVFDPTKENAFDDAFYVINSNYEVWMCTANGGVSTTEPKLDQFAPVSPIDLDGITWTYMYSVNRYEYAETPTGWLSANYGTSVDTSDTLQDMDSFIKLGARYLLVKVEINDPVISSEFSAGIFRQIGLISHPRLSTGELVINTYEDAGSLTAEKSGYVVYLENREDEGIIDGQNTELKITLRF